MEIGYLQTPDAVRLFAWHEVDNYGDRLGPALFHLVTKKPVYIEARGLRLVFDQGEPRTIHCFLGTLAQLISGNHHFVFWGFGTAPPEGPDHHGCRPLARGLDLDIRALRGPLTRDVLIASGYHVPETVAYGDPGLLVPGFFSASADRVDQFCVIPHHAAFREWRDKLPGLDVIDLNVTSYEGLPDLIRTITRYSAVFSASLHATILAESFGIPVRPIAPTLPFKFDDFYRSVGKKAEYIPEMRPDLDWGRLYEETVRDWRPIVWNPEPLLESSPFPIDSSLRRRLKDHYAQLSKARTPAGLVRSPEGTPTAPNRIDADAIATEPRRAGAGSGESGTFQLSETCLLLQNFRTVPDNWYLMIDGRTLRFSGDQEPAKIVGEGCELREQSGGVHLITNYVAVAQALEFRARIECSVQGRAEWSLQDEQFRTIAQATIGPDDGPTQEMTVWPVDRSGGIRLVISPLRGRLVVRQIRLIGLA